MGRSKEPLYELYQQKEDKKLAELLGITYDELKQTEWHIETHESNDGDFYGYVVYFDKKSPKRILNKIKGFDKKSYIVLIDSYIFEDEEQYEAISSNTQFLFTFKTEIENLKELHQINIDNPSIDLTLRRQIFIGIITSMETYLSDAFINTTLNSEEFTKNFVKTFHEFGNVQISLNELYDYNEKIEKICKQEMLDVIYHNLPKIKGMYKDTLGVDIGNIGIPYKAVIKRHDLVHRNGKTKKGQEVIIEKEMIDKLFVDIDIFIENIEKQIETFNLPIISDYPNIENQKSNDN